MADQINYEDAANGIVITATSAAFRRREYPIAKIVATKTRIKDANRFLRTLLQVCGALVAGISPFIFVVQNVYLAALVLLVGVLLILVSLAIRRSQEYSVILKMDKREFEAATIDSAEDAGKVIEAINAAVKTAHKQAQKPRLTPGKHIIE